jgi:uncharacterized hydrophobic protein (TIGR00271 family)
MEPEERRRIMTDLAVSHVDGWATRFLFMLTLSVIVAVMGLELNSAAVVIGAMLLAPLMQPVLATGACLATALFFKSWWSLLRVTVASVWSISVAYGIAWVLPDAVLTTEVLARTQPDIRDLVVALAAGAAGAYATVRSDVSSSLPGVAVAVALVPPLASVGITLEAGEYDLAQGALLLYVTNLTAIVLASIAIFVVTGFVAPRRLSDNFGRLGTTGLVVTGLLVLVALPLYQASVSSIDRNNQRLAADDIVATWLGEQSGAFDRTVQLDENSQTVLVIVRGTATPPPQSELAAAIEQELPGYSASVQWIRAVEPTTTTAPPPEPTEELLADIRVVVDAWLAAATTDYQIDNVSLSGNEVRIDAAGVGDPPQKGALIPRLTALDPSLSPLLNWVSLETFTETTMPSAESLLGEELEAAAREWAGERGLALTDFQYVDGRVGIELRGAVEPSIVSLELILQTRAGDPDLPVDVFFIQRARITTTTTLPAAAPTTN